MYDRLPHAAVGSLGMPLLNRVTRWCHITPPSVRQVHPGDLIMCLLLYTYCDTFSYYYYYSRMDPIGPRETNLTTVFIRFVFHLLHCLWISLVRPNCFGLRTLFHLHKCPIKNVTPKCFLICNVCLCYNGSVKFFFYCGSSFHCLSVSLASIFIKHCIFYLFRLFHCFDVSIKLKSSFSHVRMYVCVFICFLIMYGTSKSIM